MEKTIIAEAENIELALKRAKSQVPEGWVIVNKDILSDGKTKTVKADANTLEDAWEIADADVPSTAKINTRSIIREPEKRSIKVNAFSEHKAKEIVLKTLNEEEAIEEVVLNRHSSESFLSVFRKKTFQVDIIRRAHVEVSYTNNARIRIEIDLCSSFLCAMCNKRLTESDLPVFKNENGAYVCSSCLNRLQTNIIRSMRNR